MLAVATFINRTDSRKTTGRPPIVIRMPRGPEEIEITEVASDSKQIGAINNSVSGNTVSTTVEFLQLHFNSAMAVVMLVVSIVVLCCCWRALKIKNLKKIAKFVCIDRCRVTQEMLDDAERPRNARLTNGSTVEIRELETALDMAHKSAMENAILRNQRRAPTLEEINSPASC